MFKNKYFIFFFVVLAVLSLVISAFALEQNEAPGANTVESESVDDELNNGESDTNLEMPDAEEVLPSEPVDPIPAGWAHDALTFCVKHDVISLETLDPTHAATRAEFASMLVALFQPTEEADLSDFSDVDPDAWYCNVLSKAVAMGLYNGADGKLLPDETLTREQAFVILGRTFGVAGGTSTDLCSFPDYARVSSWAVSNLGALVSSGYVTGSGGKLLPKATITQQELAQLIYKLTGSVSDDPTALPASGSTLLRLSKTGKTYSNLTIAGDLLLLGSGQETLTLRNVSVSGRLLLRNVGGVSLDRCTLGEVVLFDSGDLTLRNSTVSRVSALGAANTISGSANSLYSEQNTTLRSGAIQTVTVGSGVFTLSANTTADTILLPAYAASTSIQLDGCAQSLESFARNTCVTGSGKLQTATIHHSDANIALEDVECVEAYDPGLSGVTFVADASTKEPSPTARTATVAFRVSGIDTSNGFGSEIGVRYCSVQWVVDGQVVQTTELVPISEGTLLSLNHTYTYRRDMRDNSQFTLRLFYNGEKAETSATIQLHNYSNEYYDTVMRKSLASQVSTLQVEATLRRNATLYADMYLSSPTGTVSKGTIGIYDAYYGVHSGRVRLPDGTTGWVAYDALEISTKNYVREKDYTTEVKEAFVNYQNYTSSSQMLVWISLKTQKVNVFTGSKGSWKLDRTFSVCSGKNTTPTISGVFRYQYRLPLWDFGDYYVNKPMVFNGGHAFHSRTYSKANGTLLDPTIGRPASHGCIRMYDEDINWLWDNMKIGTTVVVF